MKRFILFGISIVLLVSGCGKVVEPIQESVGKNEVTIGSLEKNQFALEIESDTFQNDKSISIEPVKDYQKMNQVKGELLSEPLSFNIDMDIPRFNKPITISFPLTDKEIKDLDEPEDIWIGYFNGKEWENIRPSKIDLENKIIEFETYHFSLFSKSKPTKKERIDKFAGQKAEEIWNETKNNSETQKEVNKLVGNILKDKFGITDKSLQQDVVEAILKENDYTGLMVSYKDNKMDEFGQNMAVLAGKKIFKIIEEMPETNAGLLLDKITQNASKIGTGVQMASYIAEGKYEDAAKALSNEILDTYPITKLFKTAAQITDRQIKRWKDQELQAAYEVFKNGAESNIPFWGYQVEKGDFDALWDQMRGLQTKVLDDAIHEYALKNGISVDSMGPSMLEKIRKEAKQKLRQEMTTRLEEEKEIEKIKKENMKLLEVYEETGLLEKYSSGYWDDISLEFRMERLFRIKDMILKDTGCRMTGNDSPEIKEISPETISMLTSIWYKSKDGKEQYRKKLVELGYIEPGKALKIVYITVPSPAIRNYLESINNIIPLDENGNFNISVSDYDYSYKFEESDRKDSVIDFRFTGSIDEEKLEGYSKFYSEFVLSSHEISYYDETPENDYAETWTTDNYLIEVEGDLIGDEYGRYQLQIPYKVNSKSVYKAKLISEGKEIQSVEKPRTLRMESKIDILFEIVEY